MQIGIAGAGIMGRLLAWQLSQQGHQITIFDQDPIESGSAAAYTAAGMLTPFTEVESAEWQIYHMGMRGLSLWPQIAKQLGSDLGFHQRGSLIVAHPSDQADLQRFQAQLQAKLVDDTQAQLQLLNAQHIAELEPELANRFQSGLFLPQESWLCTKCVMQTLAEQLLAKRVCWYSSSPVDAVQPGVIHSRGGEYQFDWVIDCRGMGAKTDISQLRGVRGELIWVDAPEVNISHMVRLMHPRYRLYLVPRKDNLYVLGATQIESEDYSPISVRSSLELLSALYSIHPGFAEARVVESKTNCRPALMDNLPAIDVQEGLMRVNGLFRHGFLLAPVLVEAAVQQLQGGSTASEFQHLYKRVA